MRRKNRIRITKKDLFMIFDTKKEIEDKIKDGLVNGISISELRHLFQKLRCFK